MCGGRDCPGPFSQVGMPPFGIINIRAYSSCFIEMWFPLISNSIFPPPELTKRTRMTRAIFKAVWFLGGGRWGILNATVLSHCKVVTSFFTEPVLIFLYFQLDLELCKIGS